MIDKFRHSSVPATNWWACYRADIAQAEATKDRRVVGKDDYKGKYFYLRIVMFVCNTFWEGREPDPINMASAIVGGTELSEADYCGGEQFAGHFYSEKDLSCETRGPNELFNYPKLDDDIPLSS